MTKIHSDAWMFILLVDLFTSCVQMHACIMVTPASFNDKRLQSFWHYMQCFIKPVRTLALSNVSWFILASISRGVSTGIVMTPWPSTCRRFCCVVCRRCSFVRVLLILALFLTGMQILHVVLVSRLESRQETTSGFPHREDHDALYKSVIMAIESSQVIGFNCLIIDIKRWMFYCTAGNKTVDILCKEMYVV